MQLLSSEEYQDRINPWLNKNLNLAHCIPVSFPRFRSLLINEVFLFALTVMLFVAAYAGTNIFFSVLGMNGNSNIIENLVGTLKNSKALILFLLLFLVYLRVTYFVLSRLNNELSVMVAGFSTMMLIPFIAEGMPVFEAWLNGNTLNYYSSPTQTGLIMWAFVSFVLTRKLLRQFHEAKAKNTAKAN